MTMPPRFLPIMPTRVLLNFMGRKKQSPAMLSSCWNFSSCGLPNLRGATISWPFAQAREPQSLVGCCGLRTADSKPGRAELGIELAPDYWGRYGYAIEVARGLVDFGFTELGLQEIYGDTVSSHTRVERLARWFGAVAAKSLVHLTGCFLGGGVEWQIKRDQWESVHLTNGSIRPARRRQNRG